ncbi:MAG: flavin-containing monooxygenase [Ilumatobacteraceae bacterium]
MGDREMSSSLDTFESSVQAEHHDVIVVGAGISGIGAAYHLQKLCPDRTFTILEGRSDIGGTWDLFRYPGIRSDSDMHTLGYSFKPWTAEKSIADGPSIMAYLRETVEEFDIQRHIRFNHKVVRAEWDSSTSTWTVHAIISDARVTVLTCNFLFMCSGYYSYRGGYDPAFEGRDTFTGQIVHPQQWPDDLDYEGKKVVVIGSGATAVTIVPAMADKAEHVTMLQRSPTWMVARPDVDPVAKKIKRFLPRRLAHPIIRAKNVFFQQFFYKKTRTDTEMVKGKLLQGVRALVGPDVDIDKHFTPSYNPWDQRLCLVPNGDLFAAVRNGSASVVTDTITSFTETGVALTSGEHLDADIIVTATGLELVTLGDMDFVVDGKTIDFSETFTYRGVAYSGVPNLVSTFGYINASWTLRADLTSTYVCRLLNHMRKTKTDQVTPVLRDSDITMAKRPWIDDFSSGYMQRMMPTLPKQGDREPWTNPQRLAPDKKALLKNSLEDGVLTFTASQQLPTTNQYASS